MEKAQIINDLEGLGVERAQARKVADSMDLSRDGSVGWTEFVAACINLGSDEFEHTLREAFDEADSDDDGLLTQRDLSKMLPSGYTTELTQDMFGHLTGRTEVGARLDWSTFHQHFRPREPTGTVASSLRSVPASEAMALGLPGFCNLAKEAADKVRSRWFPVPGLPEQEEEHLRRLADMGFGDRERCLAVLRRHRNELSNSAVEELVCMAER